MPHELLASQNESSSALHALVDKGIKYFEQGKRDEAKQCFHKAADQGYVPEKPKRSSSIRSQIVEWVIGIITDIYNKLKRW